MLLYTIYFTLYFVNYYHKTGLPAFDAKFMSLWQSEYSPTFKDYLKDLNSIAIAYISCFSITLSLRSVIRLTRQNKWLLDWKNDHTSVRCQWSEFHDRNYCQIRASKSMSWARKSSKLSFACSSTTRGTGSSSSSSTRPAQSVWTAVDTKGDAISFLASSLHVLSSIGPLPFVVPSLLSWHVILSCSFEGVWGTCWCAGCRRRTSTIIGSCADWKQRTASSWLEFETSCPFTYKQKAEARFEMQWQYY